MTRIEYNFWILSVSLKSSICTFVPSAKAMNFSAFEKRVGITFIDKNLLRTAFTHRSYLNENRKAGWEHNERLEFLGDAVLELIVTEYLFDKYADRNEGDLTSYRSALVNAITLAGVAEGLGLN